MPSAAACAWLASTQSRADITGAGGSWGNRGNMRRERARDVRMLRSINSSGLADCATDGAALLIRALAAEVRVLCSSRDAPLALFVTYFSSPSPTHRQ